MRKIYPVIVVLTIGILIMMPGNLSKAGKKPEPPGVKPKPCHGIPFEEVLNKNNTGFFEPDQGIINSEREWCQFWDKLYANIWPKPECDTTLIDFENETAIYVALGSRSNSCYAVDITCVTQVGKKLEVDYDEIIPGKGCFCFDVVVTPVDVVKIEKYKGPVEFQHHIKVHDCL